MAGSSCVRACSDYLFSQREYALPLARNAQILSYAFLLRNQGLLSNLSQQPTVATDPAVPRLGTRSGASAFGVRQPTRAEPVARAPARLWATPSVPAEGTTAHHQPLLEAPPQTSQELPATRAILAELPDQPKDKAELQQPHPRRAAQHGAGAITLRIRLCARGGARTLRMGEASSQLTQANRLPARGAVGRGRRCAGAQGEQRVESRGGVPVGNLGDGAGGDSKCGR